MCPSRNFIVSHFTFKSVVYLELILVYDTKWIQKCFVLCAHAYLILALFVENTSLLGQIPFAPLLKII